jgi:ribokinase
VSVIHVVGNCTVDVFFRLERFPEPGETLIASHRFVDLGGKGANQAVAAARFGLPVRLVAPLGSDADGAMARERLAAEGLPSAGLLVVDHPTDQSIITVVPGGENTIVSSAAAARALTPAQAETAVDQAAPTDIVMVQGNLTRETTLAALRRARERGALTFVNPAPIQWDWEEVWALADTSVLNRVEARWLLGTADPGEALAALRGRGCARAVVTLGAEGAVAEDAAGRVRQPALQVEATDTAGAGDTFCAALAVALALGRSLDAGVALAQRAAALTVSRPGTQSAFPTCEEARALLEAAAEPVS